MTRDIVTFDDLDEFQRWLWAVHTTSYELYRTPERLVALPVNSPRGAVAAVYPDPVSEDDVFAYRDMGLRVFDVPSVTLTTGE